MTITFIAVKVQKPIRQVRKLSEGFELEHTYYTLETYYCGFFQTMHRGVSAPFVVPSSTGLPTKPKLLPAAWEGKTGGAAGSREAAGPIWCSLTSRPNSGLSLSLGDGDGSPGDHHLLNTSSVLIVIPGWHCGT